MAPESAQKNGGAAAGRFCVLLLVLPFLTACGSIYEYYGGSERRVALAPAPPPFDPSSIPVAGMEVTGSAFRAETIDIAEMKRLRDKSASLQTETYAPGCSIGDRFDRSAALSWHFDDRRRLSLNMRTDGVSIETMRVSYVHKFGGPPKKNDKKKCRYDSKFQGIIGSAYNEMFLRKEQTIWNELDDHGLAVWRR